MRKAAYNVVPSNSPDTFFSSMGSVPSAPPLMRHVSTASYSLSFAVQPPKNQRTSSATEKRTFKVKVRLNAQPFDAEELLDSMSLMLVFADDSSAVRSTKKDLPALSGVRTKLLSHIDDSDGMLTFSGLMLHEVSSKHKDREFAIVAYIHPKNDESLIKAWVASEPIFTYSHPKVLAKRKKITLRCLSSRFVHVGSDPIETMHVVGSPFLHSSRQAVRFAFNLPNGRQSVRFASNLELYSKSVIFFTPPSCPFQLEYGQTIGASVSVSNNGEKWSNAIIMTYKSNAPVPESVNEGFLYDRRHRRVMSGQRRSRSASGFDSEGPRDNGIKRRSKAFGFEESPFMDEFASTIPNLPMPPVLSRGNSSVNSLSSRSGRRSSLDLLRQNFGDISDESLHGLARRLSIEGRQTFNSGLERVGMDEADADITDLLTSTLLDT